MFSQTLQDQASTFEETLLLSLFSIINGISQTAQPDRSS